MLSSDICRRHEIQVLWKFDCFRFHECLIRISCGPPNEGCDEVLLEQSTADCQFRSRRRRKTQLNDRVSKFSNEEPLLSNSNVDKNCLVDSRVDSDVDCGELFEET